jgi:hypothetical protein
MRPTVSKTAVRAEAKDKVMEGMEGGLGGIDRGRRFGIQTPLLLQVGRQPRSFAARVCAFRGAWFLVCFGQQIGWQRPEIRRKLGCFWLV